MIIDQGYLFRGMSMAFMDEFMALTTRESYNAGDVVFREGDPAQYFYTLVRGGIRLNIGETGKKVYTVSKAGEAFGWSSVAGRDVYSASAECSEPATLLRIDRNKLGSLLEKYPDCGMLFYKKLSEILGERLIGCYQIVSAS